MSIAICTKGLHNLVDIYSHGPDMERLVVRWCQVCGAVVIDTDVDGRTAPGDVMNMLLPRITIQHKEGLCQ